MKHTLLILLILFIFLITSCGKQISHRYLENKATDAVAKPENKDLPIDHNGTYVAVLDPLNADVIGFSSGAVTINLNNDEMITNIRFAGQAPKTIHAQSIHAGSFCPSEIADSNMDGVVDVLESLPYTGNTLIPLDSNLNSQAEGQGFYPLTDDWGDYIYSLTNSFHSLMTDLYSPDADLSDTLEKLIPNSPLNLEERVVMIYGTLDSETLPATAGSLPGLTANQTLPIACGVFRKVTKLPGTLEPDEVQAKPQPRIQPPTTNGPHPTSSSRTPSRPVSPPKPEKPQTNTRRGPIQNQLCRNDKACLM